jgi:flagellum-specific peptidoglycan hydrolase FlgJ
MLNYLKIKKGITRFGPKVYEQQVATDPKYPDKLISYIERYQLHQYDDLVLGINSNIKIKEITDELNI